MTTIAIIFLGKKISTYWVKSFVANMCENWTSVRERSATMHSWSNIALGSRQTVVAAYSRRYESIKVFA